MPTNAQIKFAYKLLRRQRLLQLASIHPDISTHGPTNHLYEMKFYKTILCFIFLNLSLLVIQAKEKLIKKDSLTNNSNLANSIVNKPNLTNHILWLELAGIELTKKGYYPYASNIFYIILQLDFTNTIAHQGMEIVTNIPNLIEKTKEDVRKGREIVPRTEKHILGSNIINIKIKPHQK